MFKGHVHDGTNRAARDRSMKDQTTTMTTVFRGAQVLLSDDLVEADVSIANGVIAEIGSDLPADRTVDARGCLLAPALIDLHGDAFERQMMPRPGVFFPLETALLETDRQLAANGIATAYHALTIGWAPGLRSVEKGAEFLAALQALAPRLTVENRVQLRWETFAFEAVDLIRNALHSPLTPSLAFNDHLSMSLRSFDTTVQARGFEHSANYAVADLDDPRILKRFGKDMTNSGLPEAEYLALARKVWARRLDVPGTIAQLAEAARAAGAPMLSHDDTRSETRAFFRGHGSRVSEFPMTLEAAQAAREGGDTIIFGSPNAVRGGSHIGSLAAADMVEAGLCDALASDYFYPAMLAAVSRMDREKRADRATLWSLVSDGPARAMGLTDRGRIAPGLRADLVLLEWPEDGAPAVLATYVAGRAAYQAQPLGH